MSSQNRQLTYQVYSLRPTLTSGSQLGATVPLSLKISWLTIWTLLAYLVPPRDLGKRANNDKSPILSGLCSALQPQHADKRCSCNLGQFFILPAQGRSLLPRSLLLQVSCRCSKCQDSSQVQLMISQKQKG